MQLFTKIFLLQSPSFAGQLPSTTRIFCQGQFPNLLLRSPVSSNRDCHGEISTRLLNVALCCQNDLECDIDFYQKHNQNHPKTQHFIGITLWLFNIAMEAMAHRNRWFTYLKNGDFFIFFHSYLSLPEGMFTSLFFLPTGAPPSWGPAGRPEATVPPSAAPVPIDPKVDPAEFYCRMMRENRYDKWIIGRFFMGYLSHRLK